MTQPDYVPIAAADRIRPIDQLPAPDHWFSDRPGDVAAPRPPPGPKFGSAGPDSGYGLTLAQRFVGRLRLVEGETEEDAIAGCFAVGSKRASMFGRAPVIYDLELAFTLWGLIGDPPEELVRFRKPLFQGAAHDYWAQRAIVDRVRETTLLLSPAQVRERLADWKSMVVVGP